MISEPRQMRELPCVAAAGLFTSLVVVSIAAAGGLARFGFSRNDFSGLSIAVGICWFLIHFPRLVRVARFRMGTASTDSWLTGEAALLLIGLTLVTGVGFLLGEAGRWAGVVFAGIGAALFTVCLVRRVATGRLRQTAGLLALSVFVGAHIAGASWGSGYHDPLFVEGIAFGNSNIDTLFHTSICQMIRTYGVPSTGLDGIPLLHYHFGSHWVFAQLSRLLGMTVIDFYNLGFEIVVVPFCLHSLIIFAVGRGEALPTQDSSAREAGVQLRLGKLFWFVLCVGYMGFLPMSADVPTSLSRNALIISESYGVSVAVSLLTTAAMISFYQETRNRTAPGCPGTAWAVVLFPLWIAAIGLLKLSVMIVAVAAFAYAFLRLQLFRNRSWQMLAVLTLLSSAATASMAAGERFSIEAGWYPFGFIRMNVSGVWWAYFWPAYYLWAAVYAAARLFGQGAGSTSDLGRLVRDRRIVDLELLAVVAVVGALPGLLLTGDSSAHYFSDCQRWLALGLLVGLIASDFPVDRTLAPFERSRPPGSSLVRVAGIALGLCITATVAANTLAVLNRAAAANLAARGHPGGGTGIGSSLMRFDLAAAGRILESLAAETETQVIREKPLLGQLKELSQMPMAEKRRTLLFIPKSNRQYWDLLRGRHWPANVPFVAPALSGIAMIEGLHEPPAQGTVRGYGYGVYARSPSGQRPPPVEQHKSELCQRAVTLGFERIVVLADPSGGEQSMQTWQCGSAGNRAPAPSRGD